MITNKMEWFKTMETGLVMVGNIIGNEQDVLEWIADTESNTVSGLTYDDICLEDYRIDDTTYKYYLTFSNGYDVEIIFKKDEDGLYVVNQIEAGYDEEETGYCYPYEVSDNEIGFKILSDE